MNEKRESCLAAILARGLMRVRQTAQRTGNRRTPGGQSPKPTTSDQPPMDVPATVKDQGEQQ